MDIYMLALGVPECQKDVNVCFMQQGIKFTEVSHIMWFFADNLI